MPTIQQCQHRTTHKWDSYGFTAEADKVFCVILSLIVHGIAFYVLLSISLIIWENYIIEACISRWKMELQSFDTGPEPAWLADPPTDFLHLPPGADKYVNFSLSLFLKNSPPWLGVELSSVRMLFFEEDLLHLLLEDSPAFEEGTISISAKVPLSALDEVPYLCLRYAPGMVRTLAMHFMLEARFTLSGRKSNTFLLSTNLTYDLSLRGNYTDDHKLGPRGEWIAQICREHCSKEASPAVEHHTGEVVVVTPGYVSSPTFIRLSSLYDADMM
ncbi:hypothetical protein FOZ63_029910 [Perkinsus olseni]|uniref:Uncharacterized protein n=1 Tax=Perkinsus olseni TaxID=32597 RepID=A0A7J6UGS6_PEROL|nr:hypothetical protein FOZ63_029910 [Perkinsus olseni]